MADLEIEGIGYEYDRGDVAALTDVSWHSDAGTIVAVTGPSGSGKSTLLAIIAGMARGYRGEVRWRGTSLGADTRQAARWRRDIVSYAQQSNPVIGRASVADNIALGLRYREPRVTRQQRRALVDETARRCGIGELLKRRADTLSGGQRQRVAIARAIIAPTPILLADEPTSALDESSRSRLLATLREEANRERLVIVATHDPLVSSAADAVLELRDGQLKATLP